MSYISFLKRGSNLLLSTTKNMSRRICDHVLCFYVMLRKSIFGPSEIFISGLFSLTLHETLKLIDKVIGRLVLSANLSLLISLEKYFYARSAEEVKTFILIL